MFGPIATFLENLVAGWVSNSYGPTSMIGLSIGIVSVAVLVVYWHRQQRAAKNPGMASLPFIFAAFAIGLIAVGFGCYGLGLYMAKPQLSGTSVAWLLPKTAAEKFVPSGRDTATSLRQLLLSGILKAQGTPHVGKAGDPAVPIPAAEWQSLTLAGQDFSSAASKQGPTHSYDNLEFAMVGDYTPAFWDVVASPTPHQNPAQTPPATTATPKVVYTERDIRELLDAMKDAKNLVASSILPTSIEIETLVGNSFNRLPEDGATKRVSAQLREIRNKLKTIVWDQIDKFVYTDHVDYKEQMRIAFVLNHEAVKGELNRSLLAYAEDIERLPNQPSQETLELIRPRFEETRRQSNIVYNWAIQVRNRVASVTTNLQTQGVIGFDEK